MTLRSQDQRGTTIGLARQTLRMSLKPHAAPMGAVDGAWWPRSWDSLAEFPAMIAGIEHRLGIPNRVAFNADAWTTPPRRMVVDGQAVRLEGFSSLDKHTVVVSGYAWHRMVLLIVPPETSEPAAKAALARASDAGNAEEPAQILMRSGCAPPPTSR